MSHSDLGLMLGPERARELAERLRVRQARLADQVDVVEIAAWLGVSERTVWDWRRRGVLPEPVGKRGRRAVWSIAEIVAALQASVEPSNSDEILTRSSETPPINRS